jgi:GH25 family lysozyme M1 (1,4-beta-N-acetylmuramidase)
VFLPATFNIFNKPIVESTYVFDTVDLNIEEMIKEIDEWVNENKENKNENSIIYIYTVFKCIDHYYIRCYRERYKKIKILGE